MKNKKYFDIALKFKKNKASSRNMSWVNTKPSEEIAFLLYLLIRKKLPHDFQVSILQILSDFKYRRKKTWDSTLFHLFTGYPQKKSETLQKILQAMPKEPNCDYSLVKLFFRFVIKDISKTSFLAGIRVFPLDWSRLQERIISENIHVAKALKEISE